MPQMKVVFARVSPDGFTEEVYFRPSFTCGENNCCEGKNVVPSEWHGIGSSQYWYCLKKGNRGVSLTVSTGEYDQPEYRRAPTGDDLSSHRPPSDWHREEGAFINEGCLVTGGECFSDGTTLGARELYEALGENPSHDAVLRAMRPYFEDWVG